MQRKVLTILATIPAESKGGENGGTKATTISLSN